MSHLGRILTAARYVVILGVLASLALMLLLFVVIVARTALVIGEAAAAVTSAKAAKLLVVNEIELADLMLLAVALYIIALGLFELFIAPAPMPSWLVISSLDDLKSKLINIIVVALGVSFFGQVITWDGSTDLLPLGVAIAAVTLALAAFGALRLGGAHAASETKDTQHTQHAQDMRDQPGPS